MRLACHSRFQIPDMFLVDMPLLPIGLRNVPQELLSSNYRVFSRFCVSRWKENECATSDVMAGATSTHETCEARVARRGGLIQPLLRGFDRESISPSGGTWESRDILISPVSSGRIPFLGRIRRLLTDESIGGACAEREMALEWN